jgi:hypothetical protein
METSWLIEILNEEFKWNKARMACFVGMLLSLIKVRTVNLVELSSAFDGKAKLDSRYKRIKRFFSSFTINFSMIARWVMNLFGLTNEAVYLSMDRTNWKWGKNNINILMLSIVYKGIALPVVWMLLSKQGNSNTEERIELIKKFIDWFGKAKIAGILADREFIGGEWFKWLIGEKISFCIRIKKNVLTTNTSGKEVHAHWLFWDLKVGERRCLPEPRKIWNQLVYLSALRLTDGELLIVATDQWLIDPITHYSKRWEIETLFGCLKSKGFNFEDTHLFDAERIKKMLVLLTVAFCWAHKTGEWRHEQKPITVKKHGRKAQSLFKYGLDYLRDALFNSLSPTRKQLSFLVDLIDFKGIG